MDTAVPMQAAQEKPRFPLNLAVKLALLCVFIYMAWRFVDWRQFWASLSGVSPLALLGLAVLATLDRFAMAFKWMHLSRGLQLEMPPREWVRAYYGASFLSYFVPSGLGGDFYRAHKVSQLTGKRKETYASLAMEKIIGALSTITLFWLGLLYFLFEFDSPMRRLVVAKLMFVTLIAVAGLLLTLHPKVHGMAMRLLARFHLGKVTNAAEKLYTSYLEFGRDKRRLFDNFLMSLGENGIQFVVTYSAAVLLGVQMEPLLLFAIVAVNNLVQRISMYIDSWGLSEAMAVLMYGIVGIPPAQALAISLLRHAISMLVSLPGGVLVLRDRRLVS